MEKTYQIKGLCCANCAAKMENKIKKLPGVEAANINFMTRKLRITAREADMEAVAAQAKAICEKIEPDCEVLL